MFHGKEKRSSSFPYSQLGRRIQTNTNYTKRYIAAIILIALPVASCDGSDESTDGDATGDTQGDSQKQIPGDIKSIMQSFEGIYQLQTFTENPSGCDEEGPSTFETKMERRFVLVADDAPTPSFLWLASCIDDVDCATVVESIHAGDPGDVEENDEEAGCEYEVHFGPVIGPDELQAQSASLGAMENGLCIERYVTESRLLREGDTLRIESRRTKLNDRPPENGICYWEGGLDALIAEAADLPCNTLTAFTGTRLAALP
jgi:hypothetical protein